VDNVAIALDSDDERNKHNTRICNYLSENKAYWSYLDPICEKIGYGNYLSIIDKSIHPHHLKAVTKVVFGLWSERFRKSKPVNDNALIRLLSHDCNRQLLRWSLMRHQQKKTK
jgi:hypothetical protein